jgi:8-oxo-dGTP pyrophosphatase MutT (NUDIX family)
MRALIIEKFAASKLFGPSNDPPFPPEAELRSAAVLVPLVDRASGMTVLLTQRATHLSHHGGQISFPGGSVEHTDDSPIATALRETEEEIGLPPSQVEIVGYLPSLVTGTGFCIVPILGIVRSDFNLKMDTREVEEVFEVPLQFILDPRHHELRTGHPRDKYATYYALNYQGRNIWGATARILLSLYRVLCEVPPPTTSNFG